MSKQNRESIRESVFTRDNNKCVIPWCHCKPDDAHHLIERKLWDECNENGGYIKDNLVSVCEFHHKLAENNTILPQTLREYTGIKSIVIPASLNRTETYDKWGHTLAPVLREKIKYPHTPYLPFSPNTDEKDVRESGYMDLRNLLGKPLSFSIKMDGSNIVMTRNYVAARNGYDATGTSFDMAKQIHSMFRHLISEDEMWFGEWLYAKHSIHYIGDLKLHNPLQLFGVYNKKTYMWASVPDIDAKSTSVLIETDNPNLISTVRIPKNAPGIVAMLNGNTVYNTEKELKSAIISIGNDAIKSGHEGIVVRNMFQFHHSRWGENIAKYVRANHVQTDEHWSQQPIMRNEF